MRLPLRAQWSQVSPLFDELVQLDAKARAKKLEQLTMGGRPDIAEDLRRLLEAAASAESENFLAGEGPVSVVRFPSLVGTRIGAHVIEEALGGGANGSVWRARPVGSVDDGSAVAIKLLHLSLVGQPAALRFRREAAVLSRLDHPSIARFLGMDSTPEGQPYLILELVRGVPIDEYCDRNRLTIRQRLTLFTQLLDAVAHAHSHHVVHRDLKPSNVLVTAQDVVKLLDFGIAKLTGIAGRNGGLTATGANVLTPHYGAPEQFRGDPPTPATDVFALGLLLFKLIAGVHPFLGCGTGRHVEAAHAIFRQPAPSMRNAIRQIADRDYQREQSQFRGNDNLVAWLAAIGPVLERLVSVALRRAPAERYADAQEFLSALTAYLQEPPETTVKPGFIARATSWAHRHWPGG